VVEALDEGRELVVALEGRAVREVALLDLPEADPEAPRRARDAGDEEGGEKGREEEDDECGGPERAEDGEDDGSSGRARTPRS
jgi:hypothetical protein